MKRKLWLNHLLGAVFAFLFSAAAVGGLVTGWDLSITSIGRLFFWCGLISVISAVLWYFKYGVWVILLLSVRGAFALWQDGELWKQVQSLAYTISVHFHDVYNWRTIGTALSETFDLALILLGYMTVLSVSCCICRRKHILIALPSVILPLALCLITTDTLPDEIYLWLLMLGIVLLLVTDWVRRRNPGQFASLTLRTALPVAAALALLFALNPQEEYVNHAAELQKKAVDLFQQLKTTAESVVSGNITGNFSGETLNLRNVGPKSDFSYTVMRVTSSYDGTVYLRGRDYDIYTGTVWESSGDREEVFPAGSDVFGSLTVVTYGVRNVLYTPYYSADKIRLTDGFAENSENTNVYSYTVSKNPVGAAVDTAGYTELPPETYQWASEMVKDILDGRTATMSKVRSIGDYVRNSASYDLSTAAMRSEHNDFAKWFLEESDTGYCVHFATAAAVLLRAAGIPARYVEGYMIPCQADEKTLVSNQAAHAWVEFYDSAADVWQILEATPAAETPSGEVIPEEIAPEETEPETEVPETAPETEDPSPDQLPDRSDETGIRQENPASGNSGGTSGIGTGGTAENSGGTVGNSGSTAGNSGSNKPAVQKKPFTIPEWVKTLARIILALAVIPVQGNLRIAYRRKQWYAGTPNEMALVRWKQSRRLAKRTKTQFPDELNELALKAKFSQHTLTREELYRFELFRKHILQTVGKMPWYRRYFLRWILAVG